MERDFIKVAPPQMLRINSKQEQNQNSQQHYHRKDSERSNQDEQAGEGNFSGREISTPQYQTELGRLILKKRNLELFIFTKMISIVNNFELSQEEKDIILNDHDITQAKAKLADLEIQIIELENMLSHTHETNADLDANILLLTDLNTAYQHYLQYSNLESESLQNNEIEELDAYHFEKDKALDSIEHIQKTVNFNLLTKIEEENQKSAKVKELFAEIGIKVKEIMKIEDENSVKLQNLREDIRFEIRKQNDGVKAISKYAVMGGRSHFIDTTK